jgi:FkbM family methyltransferase
MNPLKSIIRLAARRAGFELIPHWRLGQFAFDRHVRDLFHRLKVDFVLDVGANTGQFVEMLRRDIGYEGPVLSFEPQHDVAQVLRAKALKDGNWDVRQVALGAMPGQLTLNVCASTTYSSFKDPDPKGRSAASQVVTRRDLVEICRLDSFDDVKGSRIYLKMDTQGFDLEVVKGATGLLDRIVAVQTEVAFIPLYKDVPDWRESIETFRRLGFVVNGFFSVSHDQEDRLVTADCLLVRE